MKLNKKGFTLIELLAVVVILLAISVIAIASISAAIERSKEKQNTNKKALLESYAELYYEEHKNSLGLAGYISLGDLGLSDSEWEDANGNIFSGCIRYTNGSTFKYVESSSCP